MSAALTPLPAPPKGIATGSNPARTWNILPFPPPAGTADAAPPSPSLPAWPETPGTADPQASFPESWPSPLSVLPAAPAPGSFFTTPDLMSAPVLAEPSEPVAEPTPPSTEPKPEFTDDDLRDALGPIVEQAVRNSVYARENGIDTYLEPMLRSTIRRALAEYAPASRPFQPPGALDRFIWHMKALFTSRTYEDILFEKTRRFQVEEVYLLDVDTLALVSFASCDPARHASARRVIGSAQRHALLVRDEQGAIRREAPLSENRHLVSREGSHVVLTAVVRGRPGELVSADLEFALRRIEDHFRERFRQQGSELLLELQPFLEDCLLIQAPATAA